MTASKTLIIGATLGLIPSEGYKCFMSKKIDRQKDKSLEEKSQKEANLRSIKRLHYRPLKLLVVDSCGIFKLW